MSGSLLSRKRVVGGSEDMLCTPSDGDFGDDAQPMQIARQTLPCESHAARFRVSFKKVDLRQYADIYYMRLKKMQPAVQAAAKRTWGETVEIANRVLDLEEGKDCVLIGTLYKDMKLKPSILDEYTKSVSSAAQPIRTSFVSEDDSLVIEDESGRLKITGEVIDVPRLLTGLIVGVRGKLSEDGGFCATGLCFAGPAPQPPITAPLPTGKMVCIISGLRFGFADRNSLSSHMVADYLSGCLGSGSEQANSAEVVRVIVAGCSLEAPTIDNRYEVKGAARRQPTEMDDLTRAAHDLDVFFSQLAPSIAVDCMPGATDPATFLLPQQPLNRCLLPVASRYSSVEMVTNPYDISVSGIRILGTSGQPIDDVHLYSSSTDRLETMKGMLQCRHIAPTAPDTLGCQPFTEDDPFIIEQSPHIFFAGNQPEFGSTLLEEDGVKTRLITLPQFATTPTCALVDLESLDVTPLSFNATF